MQPVSAGREPVGGGPGNCVVVQVGAHGVDGVSGRRVQVDEAQAGRANHPVDVALFLGVRCAVGVSVRWVPGPGQNGVGQPVFAAGVLGRQLAFLFGVVGVSVPAVRGELAHVGDRLRPCSALDPGAQVGERDRFGRVRGCCRDVRREVRERDIAGWRVGGERVWGGMGRHRLRS